MTELLIYPDIPPDKRVGKLDRRTSSFKSISQSFYKGQRIAARRKDEIEQEIYTEIHDRWVKPSVLAIILLSAVDALCTLNIIKNGGSEENPIMLALLEVDNLTFLIVKMTMTIACMLALLTHSNAYLLKVISVKSIIKAILIFYTALIGYEMFLLAIINGG